MTPLLVITVISVLTAGTVILLALMWWYPASAQVQRRVDLLLQGASRSDEYQRSALVPAVGINLVFRMFTPGMPRKWGVSTGALALLLLGLIVGMTAWLLSHLLFGLPVFVSLALAAFAFWLAPHLLARFEQGRTDARFIELFPDAIDMIIRMLRAGLPVSRAIRTVSEEALSPVDAVFAPVADQIDIGIPFEEALSIAGEKVALPDFRFFAAAVTLQHTTGGNLVYTLEILADIIRKRRAVRMKARATTAEVRMSSYVLSALPFLVIVALEITNPNYMRVLISDPRGNIILLIVVLMMLLAFLSMRFLMRRVTHV